MPMVFPELASRLKGNSADNSREALMTRGSVGRAYPARLTPTGPIMKGLRSLQNLPRDCNSPRWPWIDGSISPVVL